MLVETIWTGNSYRNFHYLIACEETGEAVVIDPFDYRKCLERAAQLGWQIRMVVNTHEHRDHIAGNGPVIEATDAQLLAPQGAMQSIGGVDRGLSAGDVVLVGNTVEFSVLDTPGHTMTHICLLSDGQTPRLFCGDVLFNAGVGNCHRGGDPATLYETISTQISKLAEPTQVYPGHEYLINNLGFTLDREPDNERARRLYDDLRDSYDPAQPLITTIGMEREINVFLRLESQSLIHRLKDDFPDLPESPTPKQVFLRLRELRNRW